jgi:hypothetical protein
MGAVSAAMAAADVDRFGDTLGTVQDAEERRSQA